jgi:hypothetical protein
MINITRRKNKVFFGVKFGTEQFCFYIFNRRGAGWGEGQAGKTICWFLVFSASGGKLPPINTSPGGTVLAVPFFYILPQPLFAATINCFSVLNLKIGTQLCCLYYLSGQVSGRGGRHTQITP